MLPLLLLLGQAGAPAEERLAQILSRVSEEAEVFRQMAPKLLSQETLRQRALEASPRFRPRLGQAATQPSKPQYRTREIVSEYTFSSFRESPNTIHEFRQVISVDGRQVATREKARSTLVLGIRSEDDRLKKRLLEEFARHGLSGAAADFGQLILLFTRRRLENYSFQYAGAGRLGAENAAILSFRQKAGEESLTIFERRKAIREPLEGRLWVREPDFLPLRIELHADRKDGEQLIRDEATVDYVMSPHAVITPASVVRRRFAGGLLVVEDVFQYSPFRLFAAEAEIKFTQAPK